MSTQQFDQLVEKYWVAVTSEFWSLANKVSRELQDCGAKLVNGKWECDGSLGQT